MSPQHPLVEFKMCERVFTRRGVHTLKGVHWERWWGMANASIARPVFHDFVFSAFVLKVLTVAGLLPPLIHVLSSALG